MNKHLILKSLCIAIFSLPILASERSYDFTYEEEIDYLNSKMFEKVSRFPREMKITSRTEILAFFLVMSEYFTKVWITLYAHREMEVDFTKETSDYEFLKMVRQSFEECSQKDALTSAYYLTDACNSLKKLGSTVLYPFDESLIQKSKQDLISEVLRIAKKPCWNREILASYLGVNAFEQAKLWSLRHVLTDEELFPSYYKYYLERVENNDYPFDSWITWKEFQRDHCDQFPSEVKRFVGPWLFVVNILMLSKDPIFRKFASSWNSPGSTLNLVPELVAYILEFYCRLRMAEEAPPKKPYRRMVCIVQ